MVGLTISYSRRIIHIVRFGICSLILGPLVAEGLEILQVHSRAESSSRAGKHDYPAGHYAASPNAWINSAINCGFNAFRRSGRFKVMVWIPPASLICRVA